MNRLPSAILGASLLIAVTGAGHAASVRGHFFTVSADTGPLSFSVPTHSGFSSDTVVLGQDRASIDTVAFNPVASTLTARASSRRA